MRGAITRNSIRLALVGLSLLYAGSVSLAEENGKTVTGEMLYHTHCASCHGDHGRGDGMVGKALRTPPTDLSLLAHKNDGVFPDAMISEYIDGTRDVTAHGPRTMPVWGLVFQSQETIRKIVEYLRELQRS